jgi:F-type H+-transporting ATPase subunit epsilon
MSSMQLDVVTAEQVVFSGDADVVVAPGMVGQLGILPHHAPLMTMLQPGQLVIKNKGEEQSIAVSGGFLEVRADRVVILADAAERAEDIDVRRAEEAVQRARRRLQETGIDTARAEAALRRAVARLKVAGRTRKRKPAL